MENRKLSLIDSEFSSYWAVFLTLNCNYNCEYCVQKIYRKTVTYDLVAGDKWIRALNSITNRTKFRFFRRRKIKKFAIIGGSPTLHPDFIGIINGLDKYWLITITTNLGTPIFNHIDLFLKKLIRRKNLRFNVSLHLNNCSDPNEFINKIKILRKNKININRIFLLAYPPDRLAQVEEYKAKFAREKMRLEIQRFTGFYNGKLYPQEESNLTEYEYEDNIRDYKLYNQACNLEEKKRIWCKISKVLFAPNGDIYNCHYKLYTASSDTFGNIFDNDRTIFNPPSDYFICDNFGYCNPCDFGHAEFRKIE
jgi:MoaA/NifB/PqqE/SkfB family radical SAM enzyme